MNKTIDEIAEVCHEANRRIQWINGELEISEPWQLLDDDARSSARAGVSVMLRNVSTGVNPRMMHDAWMAEKLFAGWVYGDFKDSSKKTHPCMVDYDDLPDEQKLKDHVFLGIVKAFMDAGTVIVG